MNSSAAGKHERKQAERRAEAEDRKRRAEAALPFVEETACREVDRLMRLLTADTAPDLNTFLDIRAGVRAAQEQIRTVRSEINLAKRIAMGDLTDAG